MVRRLGRHAVPLVAALALVGGSLAMANHLRSSKEALIRRGAAPTLKKTDTGADVRWRTDAINVVVDKSFSDLAGPSVYGAAINAWRASGATLPSVSTEAGEDRTVGYQQHGKNENVIVYAPYGWAKAHGALAVTILTYDDTGSIVDADVLINGGGRYFSVLTKDESDGSSAPVSIDGSSGADDDESGTTPRFDVQNVLTHELGHFFGLGEDYDDSKATMYVSSRPGETTKRTVSTSDSGVMSGLYETQAAGDAPAKAGGCGGAKLARGDVTGASGWIGIGAASLGLMILAASRRERRLLQRLPVRAPSRRRFNDGVARFGGWLTVASTMALLSPHDLQAATAAEAPIGDADVQVVGAESHWTDGIVETELHYKVTKCHVASCPAEEQKIVVAGGKIGGLTQVVGPFSVPEIGTRATIRLRDGRGLMTKLGPTFQPRP